MVDAVSAAPSAHGRVAADGTPQPVGGDFDKLSFGDVMSAMNPLQYLPVVGTIYRVATGDDSNPVLHIGVSAAAGMLMGGPIGLGTSLLGSLLMEVGRDAFASLGAASQTVAAHAYSHAARVA